MPEVLKLYANGADIISLNSVFDSLIYSFSDEVEKYAVYSAQTTYINHVIDHAFALGGTKIIVESSPNTLPDRSYLHPVFQLVTN